MAAKHGIMGMPCPALPWLGLPCTVLHCTALPCPCPPLPCLALPCLALPCTPIPDPAQLLTQPGFSKVIALETGDVDFTINMVCPAYVRTPLVDKQIAAPVHASLLDGWIDCQHRLPTPTLPLPPPTRAVPIHNRAQRI